MFSHCINHSSSSWERGGAETKKIGALALSFLEKEEDTHTYIKMGNRRKNFV
jgi:hypothetical protein